MRIMVIAGTGDARDILRSMAPMDVEIVATVTTRFGKELLESCPGIEVHEGKLDGAGMKDFIRKRGISCMVDASHPFAREASENAIRSCEESGIAYIRFERKSTAMEGERVLRVKNFEEAAEAAAKCKGNIFLTTGSNHIHVFTRTIPDFKSRLFVRVLSDSSRVAKCEEAGLSAGNILAMKGPFSEEMNKAMFKHCNAKVMVTKESGETGGMAEKLQAAEKLGISVILIERPEVSYKQKVSTVEEVLQWVKQQMEEVCNTERMLEEVKYEKSNPGGNQGE